MGDEPTIDDYIRDYNKLLDNYNGLLERYRELQKKHDRLVAQNGDRFISMENHLQVVREHQERYYWLQEDYNKLAEENIALSDLVDSLREGY